MQLISLNFLNLNPEYIENNLIVQLKYLSEFTI